MIVFFNSFATFFFDSIQIVSGSSIGMLCFSFILGSSLFGLFRSMTGGGF